MKRVFGICLLVLLLAVSSGFGQSKYLFEVKPGNIINSAIFGFKRGRLVPFVGIDLVRISASGTFTDEHYESYTDGSDFYESRETDEDKLSGSAFVLLPNLGAKWYMGDKEARPYLFGSVFFSQPFVSAKRESKEQYWEYENGNLIDHGVHTDREDLSKDDEALIKDILSFWGITLGGGAEYFLSEHFSVGGEYGIRFLFGGFDYSDEDRDAWYDEEYVDIYKTEVSASIGLTYGLVSLNYHF